MPQAGPISQPDTHNLVAGDRLKITVFNIKGGQTTDDLELDGRGESFVPGVGVMRLSGMTLGQASNAVSRALSARYPNMRARLVSENAMSTVIYVLGEATRPGRYELPPQATLIDALLSAGGPSGVGSYRKIRVQRGGGTYLTLDLYDLLEKGRPLPNVRLLPGDRVFIPVKGPEVAVDGEVPRPALYELNGEKTLRQVIALAGGLSAGAYAPRAQISRISGNKTLIVADVDLARAATTGVANGDLIRLLAVLPEARNAVVIDGQVRRPGIYAFTPGMRVADLLKRAEGLRPEVFPGFAEVFRTHIGKPVEVLSFDVALALRNDGKQNISLEPGDKVAVYATPQVTYATSRVKILGSVTRPGEFERYDGMRIADLVRQAGGMLPEASGAAELARVDPSSGHLQVLQMKLTDDLNTPDAAFTLQDQDVLILRHESRARRWPAVVTIAGEVGAPGEYALDVDTDNLKTILNRAGGLSPTAFPKGAVFIRQTANIAPSPESLQMATDVFQLLQKIAREYAMAEAARLGAAAQHPTSSPPSLTSVAGSVDNLVAVAAGQEGAVLAPRLISRILSSGRIPIDLPAILTNGTGDPGLRDGDVIFIPREPRTVLVAGAVAMPSALPYMQKWTARDYINRAGSFTKDADTGTILVLRVNGQLVQTRPNASMDAGDIVLVAPRPIVSRPSAWEKFIQMFQSLTNGAILYQILRK